MCLRFNSTARLGFGHHIPQKFSLGSLRSHEVGRVGLARALAPPAVGFLAGSVPLSNLVARWRSGVDLRCFGNGTVSGTALAQAAGVGALVVTGIFEVAKGALGPALARRRPLLAAFAGACAVSGHNWSPWLRGAGGRGISPAMGALAVTAPAGAAVLLAGLAVGRAGGETALGSFAADVLVVPLARRYHGDAGALAAAAVVAPMVLKRLAGNRPPSRQRLGVYLCRLLFDRDTWAKAK
jgi:glycerol-3-phosphate acyltransferase PlsY